MAPTVIALGTKAGVYLQASGVLVRPEFPAATTTGMPFCTALSIAVTAVCIVPFPPRLILMMAGFGAFIVTHSMARKMAAKLPLPLSPKTLTP